MADIVYTLEGDVYLNITNKCPCNCAFCIRSKSDAYGDSKELWFDKEPTFEEIKKAIDDYDFHNIGKAVFCGYGEPTNAYDNLIKSAKYLKEINPNTLFHVDAVASFGKLPMEIKLWKADMLSVSGHKVHAPKGIGALYIREGLKLRSLIDGGSHEFGMRAGTENTIGIVAFGEACKVLNESKLEEYMEALGKLREYTKEKVIKEIPESIVNGTELIKDGKYTCSPYVINLGFKGVKAETLLHHLASYKIYVSTTSACSSKDSKQESRILKEIGTDKNYVEGSIRVTFCRETTKEEIDEFIKILKEGIEMLRLFRR